MVLILAGDRRQAKVILDYCAGILNSTPMLSQMIKEQRRDEIELTNGVSIEVRAATLRGVRGFTCLAVLAYEVAFWRSEESANPDEEILGALRPTLLTTKGPLIALSSPYARRGALWDMYRRHYGPEGDPHILVVKGTSRDFNPELSQATIDRAIERDPAKNRAEYLAEFRTDVEGFITQEAVAACVSAGVCERRPEYKHSYVAFVDPSGGDHPRGLPDDVANAVAGAVVMAYQEVGVSPGQRARDNLKIAAANRAFARSIA
ncbi:MAG: hypothetical protein ACRD3W_09655 [Terriglobales bacterium]